MNELERDKIYKNLIPGEQAKEWPVFIPLKAPIHLIMKTHWERVYQKSSVDKLGWYEANPEQSLRLIEQCHLKKDAAILNVGAGATTLVNELLEIGYQNIIANDISSSALEELQLRLGPERSASVRWIVDDITNPGELQSLEQFDLWHDRAVLHFFQDDDSQDAYFNLLRKLVSHGGYVIIAAFNLKEAFDYTSTMPSGDAREYVYTLFRRISAMA